MKTVILPIILFITSPSCMKMSKEKKTATRSINKELYMDKHFSSYLNKIKSMELPYKSRCFDFSEYESIKENVSLIDTTYASDCNIPCRRIETSMDFEMVVFICPTDDYSPILKTYDLTGKEISHLQVFTNCQRGPGYSRREYLEIKPDLQIIKIDSTLRWELDKEHREIEPPSEIEVSKTHYMIDDNGLIHKI